jgi:photosystem II stability/assembly factor-like uncharacterized protein
MKSLGRCLPVLVAVLAPLLCACGAMTSASRQPLSKEALGCAWLLGRDGSILATTDGGASWHTRSSGTHWLLHDGAFCDRLHGWCAGDLWPPVWVGAHQKIRGGILATTDGSHTWSRQRIPSGSRVSLDAIACTDPERVWVAGSGKWLEPCFILASTDAGATWVGQWQQPGFMSAYLTMGDQKHGWAAFVAYGEDDHNATVVLATTDGGRNWQWQKVSSEFDNVTGHFIEGLSCPDAIHCFIAGQLWSSDCEGEIQEDSGFVMATSDEGKTWRHLPAPTFSRFGALDCPDSDHLWLLADGGLTSSVDGGQSWKPVTLTPAIYVEDVAFSDALHGWVVGHDDERSVVLATTDGGTTWATRWTGSLPLRYQTIACVRSIGRTSGGD